MVMELNTHNVGPIRSVPGAMNNFVKKSFGVNIMECSKDSNRVDYVLAENLENVMPCEHQANFMPCDTKNHRMNERLGKLDQRKKRCVVGL